MGLSGDRALGACAGGNYNGTDSVTNAMPMHFSISDDAPWPARARRLRCEALERREMLSGSGLTGQYFHNADFTGLALERVEAVNYQWSAAPAPGVDGESFSARWTGQVEAVYSEAYTFRTVSNDGVRLWVDGVLLVDNWTNHAATVNTGVMTLEAGRRYDVRLNYYDNTGTAVMRLQWSSASQPLEAIPAARLYASPAGLRGEYTDATGGAASRIDAGVDFDWGGGAPVAGVAADDFRVRWTGQVRGDFSEMYTFAASSDDGARLWVGGRLVIDNWTATTTATGEIELEAGKWYDVRLEYFDASGDARVELSWSSASQTGAGMFETVAAANLRAAKATPLTFSNPLGAGADPFVVQHEGEYVLVRSSGSQVKLDRATRLEDIHSSDPASTTVTAWTAPAGTAYSTMIWAPELHWLGGKWYIYVAAAANNDNATHRMYVLERDDPDPMGPFTFKGEIAATTNRWAIDGTVLEWQEAMYFVWSGWPGLVDGRQNLYIAAMSNPWTIAGERVLLSTPQYGWESHGLPINEGPEALVHDGTLHIIFSASGYWTDQYALGRLTYNGVGPIMNPSSWTKAAAPVFQATAEVTGVGHASFVRSPDGTEHWMAYHSHHDPGPFNEDRDIRIQPFTFLADGTPNFGSPASPSVRLAVPSGYADANRVAAAGDFDADGAVDAADLAVWRVQQGMELFPGRWRDGADLLAWQRGLGAAAMASAALMEQTGGDEADFEAAVGAEATADATRAGAVDEALSEQPDWRWSGLTWPAAASGDTIATPGTRSAFSLFRRRR